GPFHLRWARDFAATRKPATVDDPISRLYAVESHPTPTGTVADVRLRARASEQPRVLAAVARELGARSPALDRAADALAPRQREVAAAAARDLARHRGKSVVVA